MDNGWIKLHRKFLDWEWFCDSKMVHLFIYLITKANHEEKRFMGHTINRGQAVIGLHSVAKATGISVQSIRTCLNRLKSTNEITIKSTNKFSIITVIKYSDYQINEKNQQADQQADQQTTNKQLTNDQQTTNNKQEVKKLRSKEKDNYTVLAGQVYDYYNSIINTNHKLRSNAIKSIYKLLKGGVSEEELKLCANNYKNSLEPGKDPQYVFGASNFYGRDARYENFKEPIKKKKVMAM